MFTSLLLPFKKFFGIVTKPTYESELGEIKLRNAFTRLRRSGEETAGYFLIIDQNGIDISRVFGGHCPVVKERDSYTIWATGTAIVGGYDLYDKNDRKVLSHRFETGPRLLNLGDSLTINIPA